MRFKLPPTPSSRNSSILKLLNFITQHFFQNLASPTLLRLRNCNSAFLDPDKVKRAKRILRLIKYVTRD